MIIKEVTQLGNPVIRTRARPVANPKSKAVDKVVKDLTDSMRFQDLVGMAAPQIGKDLRIFVTEIRKTKTRKARAKDTDKLRVFINPKILSLSTKKAVGWEGCGSVASANLFGKVKRPMSLRVKAEDQMGKSFEMTAAGLLARVIQHEMDHLNGKVFTDQADANTYMSRDEYLKMRRRMK